MKKIYLNNEYDKIFDKILRNENITLLRYGDGERSIMLGKKVIAQEGWTSPAEITDLGRILNKTLDLNDKNVYYGISCPCCDRSSYYWYRSRIQNENITFANLFVNNNYQKFKKDFPKIKRDAVVIANKAGINNQIGNLNVLKYYPIGDNCQEFFNNNFYKCIDEIISDFGMKENLLYVVSAGPLAEPIIYKLYENNKNNCYIDFGSSIDFIIHNKDTRPYVNPKTEFGSRNCWMHDMKRDDIDISVVLTTYKKPDALKKQIEAIKNQTLKPKEIILYQDGINGQYSIKFKNQLLNEFDKVNICKSNTGVWGRFKYAKDVCKSKYICLFDDDTVPGGWLENCHYEMMKQEGIYGTIGIIVQDYNKYPYTGYKRVGWDNPYSKTCQVDFVGHSWFIKKEYLTYMFENTEKYQEYKYAAEDMCLSYKCAIRGISTFVPPHPYNDESLWGSQVNYALKFGRDSVALSQNQDGCLAMKNALLDFKKNGWNFVFNIHHKKTKRVLFEIKVERFKYLLKKVYKKLKGCFNV